MIYLYESQRFLRFIVVAALLVGTAALNGQIVNKRYAGVWEESAVKQRYLIEATWEEFADTWERLKKEDFQLVDIEAVQRGNTMAYFGVWHSSKRDAKVWRGDRASIARKLGEFDSKYRLIDLEIVSNAGRLEYLAIWHPEKYDQKIHEDAGWDQFLKRRDAMRKDGYYPIDLETYRVSGKPRTFLSIWRRGKREFRIWNHVDRKTFEKINGGLEEQHYRLWDMESYADGEKRFFMGIWLAGRKASRLETLLSRKRFVQLWRRIDEINYWLIDFEVY